jgi:hypothetical protein
MDIYASLFSASIALAGFIAVFLVFRYNAIDTRVDSRKVILRSLLEDQIKTNPYIAVIIQEIGKKHKQTVLVLSVNSLTKSAFTSIIKLRKQ